MWLYTSVTHLVPKGMMNMNHQKQHRLLQIQVSPPGACSVSSAHILLGMLVRVEHLLNWLVCSRSAGRVCWLPSRPSVDDKSVGMQPHAARCQLSSRLLAVQHGCWCLVVCIWFNRVPSGGRLHCPVLLSCGVCPSGIAYRAWL